MAPQEVSRFGEADRLAFFDTVDEGFARASAATEILSRDFSIAGRRLRLRFAGDGLVPAILPAIAHRETAVEGEPDFTIDLFDAHSTGTPLPFLAARFVDLLRLRWWELLRAAAIRSAINGTDRPWPSMAETRPQTGQAASGARSMASRNSASASAKKPMDASAWPRS